MKYYLLVRDGDTLKEMDQRFTSLKQVAKTVKQWSKISKDLDLLRYEGCRGDEFRNYTGTLDPYTLKDKGY